MNESLDEFDYWTWFFRGLRGRPGGYRHFLNWWLLVHVAVGVLTAVIVECADSVTYAGMAKDALLPLVALFVGLSFSWGANAVALLQSDEVHEMAGNFPGGYVELVYFYQSAVLVILAATALWAVAAVGLFDLGAVPAWARHVGGALAGTLTAVTLRECWQVTRHAQSLLLGQRHIRLAKAKRLAQQQAAAHGTADRP